MMSAPVVRLERSIPAAPEQVYRAWLDPEVLKQWFAPGDVQVERVEVDERVGGRFRVWQSADGAAMGGFESEIIELVPNERIVFRWGFVGPERTEGPVYDSRLTITLSGAPGNTTVLVLVHERLDSLHREMPQVAERVGPGWELVLEKLAVLVR